MSAKELYVRCNKCGREAPIDNERSSVLGVSYQTDEPCRCGGEWEVAERVEKSEEPEESNVIVPDLTPTESEVLPTSMDTLSNMNGIIQAIIDAPSENLVSFIDIYLIANAKSELKRILKYLKLLDDVEDKYINKVMSEAEDYPITLMHDILGFITTSIDRSNAIITSIIKASPELPQGVSLTVGDNSQIIINNTKIDEVNNHLGAGTVSSLNSAQRERIRNYVQSVVNNVTVLEDKLNNPQDYEPTEMGGTDESADESDEQ